MESFPAKFCKGVRSYWRRRKYQRLDGGGSKKGLKVARLGGGAQTGGRRSWKLRTAGIRLRISFLSPIRLLARIRDAYVDAMLGLAGKGREPGLGITEWDRRMPRARSVRPKSGDFERRLAFEIYKSLVAAGEIPGRVLTTGE